ncbi:MAG: cupin domain-containing protein [Acidobacteria bacterium]|nr:cupin domain-containing protein [Acidobacteriota bacterium]
MQELSEQAALYAMGSLKDEELDAFERLLASGDPAATLEVERLQSVMEALVDAKPAPPSPRIKDRLMKRKLPGFEEPEPGMQVLRAGNGKWRDTGYPGVSTKILHIERDTRMATSILKLEPGAKYPPHHHTQLEQCMVLSGDVRLGSKTHIFAGDYEKALPGTDHEFLTSDTGCELLIISCLEDEIKIEPAARP